MPTIQAHIMAGHADGQTERLIAALTDAVVAAVDAPIDSVCVIVTEIPRTHFGIAGKPATDATSPRAVLHAFLIAGRTDAQKAALIERMTTAAASAIDVQPGVVRVFVTDLPNTDFGLGGKTALALGRGIGRAALVNHS
jgi:4-oxalocrotonate tautomerase family enzyme